MNSPRSKNYVALNAADRALWYRHDKAFANYRSAMWTAIAVTGIISFVTGVLVGLAL